MEELEPNGFIARAKRPSGSSVASICVRMESPVIVSRMWVNRSSIARRLELRHRIVEFVPRQIQQKRRDDALNFVQSLLRLQRDPVKCPKDPWLLSKFLDEMRLERIHVIPVTFLSQEPEDQLPRLGELAVEFLQPDHRLELRRQQIQDFRVEVLSLDDDEDRKSRDCQRRNNERLGSMRDDAG